MGVILAHPAGPEHRRDQPRRAPQPGQRVVAHRHRRGRRGPDLRRRQARPVRADAVRDPAAGRRPAAGTTISASSISTTARDHLPGVPGVLLLAAPGQLDVHRLRRVGPCRRGDGRRADRERVGPVPVGRGQRDRRVHLPDRPVDPPAGPVDPVPDRPDDQRCRRRASTTSAAASPSSRSSSTTSTSSATSSRPAIAIAMAFCGLSSVAAAGRMLFAFSRDDGIPGSGWLKKVSHRYRTPANALTAMVVVAWLFTVAAFIVGTGYGDRHRHGHQHDLPVRRVRPRIYLGATTHDGPSTVSGASAAGPSRSPTSRSSGSSS